MGRRFCANEPTRPKPKLTRSPRAGSVDRRRLLLHHLSKCDEADRLPNAANLHTMPVRTIRSHRGGAGRRSGNVFRLDRTLTELIMDELVDPRMVWPRPVQPRIIHHCAYCDQRAVTILRYSWGDRSRMESYFCQDHFKWLNERVYDDINGKGEGY
jgi:hypothetical protein